MNNLVGWDVTEQEKRVIFMEHMYRCDGRYDARHPQHGLYTNLWQNFCIKEAGPVMRDGYFEMKKAIHLYETGQLQPSFPNEFTIAT